MPYIDKDEQQLSFVNLKRDNFIRKRQELLIVRALEYAFGKWYNLPFEETNTAFEK